VGGEGGKKTGAGGGGKTKKKRSSKGEPSKTGRRSLMGSRRKSAIDTPREQGSNSANG